MNCNFLRILRFFAANLFCGLALIGCSRSNDAADTPRQQTREFNWPIMGTYAQLILADDFDSSNAVEIAKAKLEEVNAALSVFVPTSDVAQLNANHLLRPISTLSSSTMFLIHASEEINRNSGNAFNPMVAPLVELWGFYRGGEKHEFPPSATAISNALPLCKFEVSYGHGTFIGNDGDGIKVFDEEALSISGVRLDLGGIAKGYAVDAVYKSLREAGCTNFLMNLGGEMRASGTNEWKIAVRNPLKGLADKPLEYITLSNGMAVATSGGYEQFFEKDGVRYCHIIDPRTGYPVQGVEQVTVIVADAAIDFRVFMAMHHYSIFLFSEATAADALATACFVLGVEDSKALLARYGASAIFVLKNPDGSLRIERVGRYFEQ